MLVFEAKDKLFLFFTNLVCCLRNIFIAIILLFASTTIFGWVSQEYAYFRYYNFNPGQYTGYRLQELKKLDPEKTCIIVGASTAREGFNIEQLEMQLPHLDFVTLATTAGYNMVSVIDIQSSLIPKNKYACIIIGMHPFFLFAPDDPSFNLVATNYISQLTFTEIIRIMKIDDTINHNELAQAVGIALIPNKQHSEILGKHIRHKIFRFKNWVSQGLSVRRSMEYTRGDIGRQVRHYRYQDERSEKMQFFIKRRIESIKTNGEDNKNRYSSSKINDILKQAILNLDNLTDRLIVLDLPETPVYDSVIEASDESFKTTLFNAVPDLELYRCNFRFLDKFEGFVDTVHVNSDGRKQLTTELIDILNGQHRNTLCSALPPVSISENADDLG